MMKMKTQFGDMVITDDNKTIADENLQKEINNNIVNDRKIEFISVDIAKELDK